MTEDLWELIKQYIQAKIEEELAGREEGDDGYRSTPSSERKLVEFLNIEIKRRL